VYASFCFPVSVNFGQSKSFDGVGICSGSLFAEIQFSLAFSGVGIRPADLFLRSIEKNSESLLSQSVWRF